MLWARWTGWSLITGSWYQGSGQADVNTYFLTATGTKVGDTYTLTVGRGQLRVRIAGEVFDTRGHAADMFMSSGMLAALVPGLGTDQYDVGIRPGTNAQSYANALSARLGPSLDVTTTTNSPVFKGVLVLVIALTALLTAVAVLGVLNTVMLQIRERAHDLGVFKAIGMTPRQTVVMVTCSAAGIGIVAGLVAIPTGVALHRYVVPVMGHAGQTDIPAALLSVYPRWELVLLALAGLLIAVGGALGPATWGRAYPHSNSTACRMNPSHPLWRGRPTMSQPRVEAEQTARAAPAAPRDLVSDATHYPGVVRRLRSWRLAHLCHATCTGEEQRNK